MEKTIHQGRNVKRFREMMGFKQEGLAIELGGEWNQKRISHLEAKEVIEPELLEQIAKALNVPADAIKNFDEEKAIFNIQNNYEGSNPNAHVNNIDTYNYQCTINPFDKIVELYEALLKSEREKIDLLQKMIPLAPKGDI